MGRSDPVGALEAGAKVIGAAVTGADEVGARVVGDMVGILLGAWDVGAQVLSWQFPTHAAPDIHWQLVTKTGFTPPRAQQLQVPAVVGAGVGVVGGTKFVGAAVGVVGGGTKIVGAGVGGDATGAPQVPTSTAEPCGLYAPSGNVNPCTVHELPGDSEVQYAHPPPPATAVWQLPKSSHVHTHVTDELRNTAPYMGPYPGANGANG